MWTQAVSYSPGIFLCVCVGGFGGVPPTHRGHDATCLPPPHQVIHDTQDTMIPRTTTIAWFSDLSWYQYQLNWTL